VSRLRWVEIESFRGFGDLCRIDLDADSVVVTGSNGVGKTSLIDAITWSLTGHVTRLERHRERRTDDLLSNRYKPGSTPKVTLAFTLDTEDVTVTREGGADDAPAVRIGDAVSYGNDAVARALNFATFAELQYALDTWGVLHQDSMRAVLEARPDEFQTRLRDILGLGVLGEFEAWVKADHKSAGEEVREARQRLARAAAAIASTRSALEQAEKQIADADTPAQARAAFVLAAEQAKPVVRIRTPERSDLTPTILLQEVRRLQTEVQRHWSAYQVAQEALAAVQPHLESDPEELGRATATARTAFEDATERYGAAETNLHAFQERLEGLAGLAAAALPHLGPKCPVCEKEIDHDAVRRRLEALLDQTADTAALRALTQARDDARAVAQKAESAVTEAVRKQRASEEQAGQAARLRGDRDAQTEWFMSIAADDELIPIRIGSPKQETLSIAENELRRLEIALGRWERAIADESLKLQEPALRSRLAQQEEQERLARDEVERLAQRELTLQSLVSASTKSVVDVTGQWLSELSPLFGAVYNRLAAHPTFTELGLEHDIYYGKGRTLPRVYDRLLDISDNPQLVCSEGQLNIVALSYFIAFALSAGERSLPFMIMDDPLQFMDEINVLGFADLCRHLRRNRQILVTTHDHRFARLLERKLRPRESGESNVNLEFTAWERSGPRIETRSHDPQPAPELLATRA
jgi:DNA repair exonuclease SbcCD ATPase subunit